VRRRIQHCHPWTSWQRSAKQLRQVTREVVAHAGRVNELRPCPWRPLGIHSSTERFDERHVTDGSLAQAGSRSGSGVRPHRSDASSPPTAPSRTVSPPRPGLTGEKACRHPAVAALGGIRPASSRPPPAGPYRYRSALHLKRHDWSQLVQMAEAICSMPSASFRPESGSHRRLRERLGRHSASR
jgi:hypothetical protein